MIRVHCTRQDLARARLVAEPAPMTELVIALMTLQRNDNLAFQPWRQATWAKFPPDARPLLDVVYPDIAPDYLDTTEPTFDAALDTVLSGQSARLRAMYDVPGFERPAKPWVHRLAEGELEAQNVLARALKSAHDGLFGDSWPRVLTIYQEDQASRPRVGEAMIASVLPDSVYRDGVLRIPAGIEWDVHVDGAPIVVAPSAFAPVPAMVTMGAPGRPIMIFYRARVPFPLMMPTPETGRSLDALMGRTRAAVLAAIVARPAITTTDLARCLGISPGRASEHASVLRQAGLVVSHRFRNTVLHSPTALGSALDTSER